MVMTPEQDAHLKHLKREVEITKRRVLETQTRHGEELSAIHEHHIACERLRAYRETISD
jgi:hypothetical protein